MRRSRIEAVDDIVLDAPPGCEEAMRWFYGELAGLEERGTDGEGSGGLCFKSDRIRLRVRFVASPVIDPVPVRVVMVMPSLDDVVQGLEERKRSYDRISGLAGSDRRLQVLDPAGHRVEFRQSTWVGLL